MSSMETRAVRELAVSKRAFSVPARSLEDAVRLCDPFSPLDPREDALLHEDLSRIRGGDRLARIARSIRRAGGTPTLHLLSGHIGGGKTTELLLMKKRLESAEGGAAPVTTLFLDADAVLDRTDVDLEDILVALWGLVYEKEPVAAAKTLGAIWKTQIADIVRKVIANLPDKVPDAVNKLLGDVRLAGVDQKKTVRTALGSVTTALIEGLNLAFDEIRRTPPNDPTGPLVVLIDNLEKLSEGQRASVERLYLDRMVALKRLDAHLVITVPLYLCYVAAGASLIGLYGGNVVVLPMIEVRKRAADGDGDNQGGLDALVHLLERRVAFEELFEEARAAAARIARYSGGCIRHALRLVLDAVNEHDQPRVTAASIERAAGGIQADFERALPEAYVPILRQVARDNRFPDGCDDQVKRELLRHLYVLEYQNGEPDPWWAVHPLVERCRKYRESA
ncbi:hypothetical protein [Sorangium sp. So ce176]|uniref:hypothetical protein n=1 Tax=Sorangium sp. So ce176 TaxID=3133286 RepID=UPI003F5E22F7